MSFCFVSVKYSGGQILHFHAQIVFLGHSSHIKLPHVVACMYHLWLSEQEIPEKCLFLGNTLKRKGGSEC